MMIRSFTPSSASGEGGRAHRPVGQPAARPRAGACGGPGSFSSVYA